MLNLTDENFQEEIKKSDKLVLVDFFATWCGPCEVLGPIIEKVVKDFSDKIELFKANVDEFPLVSNKFNVDRIPNVVLFKNGEVVDSFIGLMSESETKKWLENALKNNAETTKPEDVQKLKDEFIKQSEEYAKKSGFNLNPDKKTVERIFNGLFENEKKYGKKYCPCRRVTGNPEEDEKKVCPCFWHKDEIAKDGNCFCRLFTK